MLKLSLATSLLLQMVAVNISFSSGELDLKPIAEALSIQTSNENYWYNKWVLDVPRTIKAVTLSDGRFLVAIEALPGDLTANTMPRLPDFIVAVVRSDGISPTVCFLPTPLSELPGRLEKDPNYYSEVDVQNNSIDSLIKENINVIKVGLKSIVRNYIHSTEWHQKIECLEHAIVDTLASQKAGYIIVHDLADTDESVKGIVVFPGEERLIGLVGEIYKNGEGSKYPYSCRVRTEFWPLEIDLIAQLLRKPLFWYVDCSVGRDCVLTKKQIW